MPLSVPTLRRPPDEQAPQTRGPALRGQRRPWLLAAGVLLCVLGSLVTVWLVAMAGQRQSVLIAVREIPYGAEIQAVDLGQALVSTDADVAVIPASQFRQVVGQVAATRLGPGMLLAPAALQARGEPGAGRVLVPLAVTAERMPAGGLRAGDRLLVVDAAPSGQGRPLPARVVRVGGPDPNGVSVIDVVTATANGPALARASASGKLALILTPAG